MFFESSRMAAFPFEVRGQSWDFYDSFDALAQGLTTW